MRYSIISTAYILFFSSCGNPIIKDLPKYNSTITEVSNPYFSNINTDYIYKAKIDAFDNIFGGILIIKKIGKDNHRIVFTTNFGSKIFDFEFIGNNMKVHYIIGNLDRNVIINTLKHDFETLTKEHNVVYNVYEEQNYLICQSKLKNRYNFFLVSKPNQVLTKIIHTTKTKEKISIKFDKIENSIAKNITIQHKKQPIKIDLIFFKH